MKGSNSTHIEPKREKKDNKWRYNLIYRLRGDTNWNCFPAKKLGDKGLKRLEKVVFPMHVESRPYELAMIRDRHNGNQTIKAWHYEAGEMSPMVFKKYCQKTAKRKPMPSLLSFSICFRKGSLPHERLKAKHQKCHTVYSLDVDEETGMVREDIGLANFRTYLRDYHKAYKREITVVNVWDRKKGAIVGQFKWRYDRMLELSFKDYAFQQLILNSPYVVDTLVY